MKVNPGQVEYEKIPFSPTLLDELEIYFNVLKITNPKPEFVENDGVIPLSILLERIYSFYANKYTMNISDGCMATYNLLDMVITDIIIMMINAEIVETERNKHLKLIGEYFKKSIVYNLEEVLKDPSQMNQFIEMAKERKES